MLFNTSIFYPKLLKSKKEKLLAYFNTLKDVLFCLNFPTAFSLEKGMGLEIEEIENTYKRE